MLSAIAVALLSAAACDDIVGTAPSVDWSSSLTRVSTGQLNTAPPPTSVSVEGRVVRLEGLAVAPSYCEDVELQARTQGQVIELFIRIVEVRSSCPTAIREFEYTVEAAHPRGEYRVIARYLHVPGGGAWTNGITADTIVVVE